MFSNLLLPEKRRNDDGLTNKRHTLTCSRDAQIKISNKRPKKINAPPLFPLSHSLLRKHERLFNFNSSLCFLDFSSRVSAMRASV